MKYGELNVAAEIIGVALLIAGIIIRYRVNRRRYYRRFEPMKQVSFERKWMSNTGEEFSVFLSIFFIIVGMLLFVFGWVCRSETPRSKIPQHTSTH